jgi:hypothetical protein
VVFAVRDAEFTFVERFPGALADLLDFAGGFFLDGPQVDMTRPPYQPRVMGFRDPREERQFALALGHLAEVSSEGNDLDDSA